MRALTKAFSLLELLITMAVISIIMAASAPGVDRWISRYRTRTFFSQLVSDMSEARLMAYSSGKRITGSLTISTTQYNRSAIQFTSTGYIIIMRTNPVIGGNWNPDNTYNRVVKTVNYPKEISFNRIYLDAARWGGNQHFEYAASVKPVIYFTPTGTMGNGLSNDLLSSTGSQCGDGVPTHPAAFTARFTASPSFTAPMYYEIHIDTEGNYLLCYSEENGNFGSGAIVVHSI